MARFSAMNAKVIALSLCLFAASASRSAARADEPVQLYAAGSLRQVITVAIAASGLPAHLFAPPVFGPAGALRSRIEKGAPADILASADLQQPRRLAEERGGRPVVVFAHGSMCAVAREAVGVTSSNVLDRMLSPDVRLATSQPGADPSGDYAQAIFDRAEALRPGARSLLAAKAIVLQGGALAKPATHSAAAGVFLDNRANMLLTYCSAASSIARDAPGLTVTPVPPDLTVTPTFSLVVLSDNPTADRFVVFLMSEQGQAILARYGFKPLDGDAAQN